MKLTETLIIKLQKLLSGETIPSSQLKGEWVESLVTDGILMLQINGSHRSYKVVNREAFRLALPEFNEALIDPQKAQEFVNASTSRSSQAVDTGNSKLITIRSCPGFPVNSYEAIQCKLNNTDITIQPPEGSFTYICDWEQFTIPEDVAVVGIENMENFRRIREQRYLFDNLMTSRSFAYQSLCSNPDYKYTRYLFVSRYPQSTDLRQWLKIIPNYYIHFGDFDLAGIHIYQTEFAKYLQGRCSFLIPSDIETRLRTGSRKRYDDQYQRFHSLTSTIPELQSLISLINHYRRCYDQEGYIGQYLRIRR
ncbi:MAG: hypothetical protein K2H60_13880 [Muribaculaceae bacterium]|nr:hypothetical protein [Muribaculaceae bacterium]